MRLQKTRFPMLLLLAILTGLLVTLNGCAESSPHVIRGTSEVIKLKTGDVAHVPADWVPAVMYCLSPVALEELLLKAQEEARNGR